MSSRSESQAPPPPDCRRCEAAPGETFCRICSQPFCRSCLSDHHHSGHGVPETRSW
ncbi:B-box zinc finger protein [Streptomyces griseobrunneus]